MLTLEEIQTWWEVPGIAHFTYMVQHIIEKPPVSIEELESGILLDDLLEGNCFLAELIISLLQTFIQIKGMLTPAQIPPEITHANLTAVLRNFLHKRKQSAPKIILHPGVEFQSLPIRKKLTLILNLFYVLTNCVAFRKMLEDEEWNALRIEPIGCDSKNSKYWHFFGKRLYREYVNKGDSKIKLEIVCFSREDWKNLANTFKESNNPDENDLYKELMHKIQNKVKIVRPIKEAIYNTIRTRIRRSIDSRENNYNFVNRNDVDIPIIDLT